MSLDNPTRPTPTRPVSPWQPPRPAAHPAAGPATTPASGARQPASPGQAGRSARLRLTRVDPWSVLTLSAALATVLALVWVGACVLLYLAADHLGAVGAVNDVYHTLIKPSEGSASVPPGPITLTRTVLVAAVTGAAGVLAATTAATLTAVAYNVCARMTKGLRVTLDETP